MMQTMRSSAKIVFLLVLVAFAGFMILQGLLSIFSDPNQGRGIPSQGVIGIVNGHEITVRAFENLYRPRAQALFQEEEEPSEEELAKIRDEIWSQLTTVTNLNIEASRHGIEITDAEVAEYMRLTPPQDLMTIPEFLTDEKFDLAKYQSWLRQVATSNNPELVSFLQNFESQIRQQVLLSRLQNLVASMARITPVSAKEDFIMKNEKVKVRHILISQNEFSSEEIEVPDSEVLARYEAERESYRKPRQAVASYVTFPRAPGDNDYNEVKNFVDSLYNRAVAGDDFAELAKEHSDDPGSGKNGGDLGWFGEGRMVEPFWEAVRALQKIGDISRPIKTQYGWHIIKLTGKREVKNLKETAGKEEMETEYQASHILVKVEISGTTLAQLQTKAENFIKNAREIGFEESAGDFGVAISQTEPFSEGGFIPGLGPVQELSDFAFYSDPGDISEVVSNRNAFIVAKLDRIVPESYTPLEEIRERIIQTLEREKRDNLAYESAVTLADEIESGKTLDDIAGATGRVVMEPDYFARHEFVQNVGSDAAYIGAAFRLSPENRYSGPVKSTGGAYILELVDFQPADTTQFLAHADSLTQELRVSKRQEAWSRWVNNLMKESEIEDYRSYYYGS
ncbi:MAG: peptidylprolyl isomerase [Candidatus Zixiibacteriota bacterium]|nr:MAG: peptidylprolyl isomerase [candidate division Zixibacteria bacterium]